MDTIETGRVYVFSRQFLEEWLQQFTGPELSASSCSRCCAILLGMRGGLADAKEGNPPYLFSLRFDAGRRKELLRGGRQHAARHSFRQEAAQARVHQPWDELRGKTWRLNAVLSGESYDRSGDAIRDVGLYVDLGPWKFHLFQVRVL